MKLSKKQLLVVISLVLFISATLPVLSACKTVAKIRIENSTVQVLTIYYDGGLTNYFVTLGDVKPSEYVYTPDFWMEESYCQINAKNAEGEVVFSREYDWWELRDMDWVVVITPPEEE